MKITVEHTENEENEVILRCRELDDEMLRLLALVRSGMQKLLVWNERRDLLPLSISDVVYCETVEEKKPRLHGKGDVPDRPDAGGAGGAVSCHRAAALRQVLCGESLRHPAAAQLRRRTH